MRTRYTVRHLLPAGTFLTCLLLAGCIVVPRLADNDGSCQLTTHSYTLGIESLGNGNMNCGGSDAQACLIILSIIPATSLVVSGSIVVVSNTAHWIERQGHCPDSATQEATTALVNASRKAGGSVLTTASDVKHWVHSMAPHGNTATEAPAIPTSQASTTAP